MKSYDDPMIDDRDEEFRKKWGFLFYEMQRPSQYNRTPQKIRMTNSGINVDIDITKIRQMEQTINLPSECAILVREIFMGDLQRGDPMEEERLREYATYNTKEGATKIILDEGTLGDDKLSVEQLEDIYLNISIPIYNRLKNAGGAPAKEQ